MDDGAAGRRTVRRGEVLRRAGHPAIVILTAAGVMSVLSDSRTVDGLVLMVVAAILLHDGAHPAAPAGPRVEVMRRRLRGVPARTAAVAGCVSAVVVGSFQPYSWPATVTVWLIAIVAMIASWPPPAQEPDPVPVGGSLVWVGFALAAGLWELSALLGQPDLMTASWDHPTISVLLDPVLAGYPGRVAVFAIWLASGWALLRRAV